MKKISVIDTHTGGEPTRVVIDGGPTLGDGPMSERAALFGRDFDRFRSSVVNEPRGSDVWVGALICPPVNPKHAAGVIYFNNVGVLGMCGHGTIGVAVALAHAGLIGPGEHVLETPVGDVPFQLHEDGQQVTLENVPSYRYSQAVQMETEVGRVSGDVVWGGNWFFLVGNHGQQLKADRVEVLTSYAKAIRRALQRDGISGQEDGVIDHIELFADTDSGADSKNFVLCPGGAFDRSPCGTGTSAKLACLAADGKLKPGEVWRQESIIGSVFEASYREATGDAGDNATGAVMTDSAGSNTQVVIPSITGSAWVNGEGNLLIDPRDPFRDGIRNE